MYEEQSLGSVCGVDERYRQDAVTDIWIKM